MIRNICVYCGSSSGDDPAFLAEAEALGKGLAAADIGLVYGGGDNGLMGMVARSTLQAGGRVTGIIPEFLVQVEQARGSVGLEGAEIIVVPDMHTRKHMMFDKADAFVTLPGGIGTLEEIVEIMTWSQLKRHSKPMFVIDINGFWEPMVKLLDHMEASGFLHNPDAARPTFVSNAADIMAAMGSFQSA
ncbi:MAG: TIGR00730 family Rossman fold protein [Pseudomonadota bacterium]